MLDLRLLGPVEVVVDGVPTVLGRPQLRVVLAILAVDAGRPVSTATLVDRVWEGSPPKGAEGVLYSHITRIRRALDAHAPSVLIRRPAGYVLDIDRNCVDLHRFRRLAAEAAGTRRAVGERRDLLRQALGLWRGTPLADVKGSWAARTRVSWRQQRLDAAVAWAHAELRLGHGASVIGEIRDLHAEYPLAEPLAAALMRALAAAGRTPEALECYQTVREQLADELGTEPGPALRSTYLAVLRGETAAPQTATPEAAAVGRAAQSRPAQLPLPVRGFAGRQDTLDALDELVATGGVIAAVSGTAGVGKTALAVHWAHRVAKRFPDGQLHVNLHGFDPTGQATDPSTALRRFLGAFGVPSGQIPADAEAQAALYRSLLAGKRVLVVLDNARDTAQVRPLLPGSPTTFTLVTSRNQLTPLVAAEGAHPFALDLMSVAEASALLESRLGKERVSAEPAAAGAIIARCARLPLALSIAAARAQRSRVALAVFADELADSRQRLDTLDAGDPVTQVRGVFSWSYRALTPAAAGLFRHLGLHPGPDISATAAASLAGLPAGTASVLLAELVQAGLISELATGRYAFHDLLAGYAADLSHEVDPDDDRRAATVRLLDHYTHTAHAADQLMNPTRDEVPLALPAPVAGIVLQRPTDDRAALDWLAVEHPVLLAAQRRAAERGLDRHAWHLAWSMDTFLHWRGHWQDRAVAWEGAVAAAERLGDRLAAAHAHRDLGRANNRLDRHDQAHLHLHRALDLFTEAGDRVGQAHTHRALASLCERRDDPRQALHHDETALDLFHAAGHRQGEADALNSVGWDHCLLGDYDHALARCQQALTLHREIGDRWGEATSWDSLGYAHHHLGHHAEAADCYRQALTLVRDLGDRFFEADTLTRLGDTQQSAGELSAAEDAWGQALAILDDLGHSDAGLVRAKLASLAATTSRPAS
ncbi:BTAD domain-containing putative transcriptional regulator [Actinomycetes bacterium KLBMP 9797]